MINGISIVICCYNSEKRIPKLLSHLNKQEYEEFINWEVLIVDNASTDKTKEVARNCWDHPKIRLRTVDEPNPGLSNAREKGLAESTFDVVSFIDDDNWVEEKWVQKVFNHMNGDATIGLLGGRGIAEFEASAPPWFDLFERAYAVGPQAKTSGVHHSILYGAGLSIRKKVWNHLKSNGFQFILSDRKGNMITSGGDSELSLAVLLSGYKLYYDQDLCFVHYMPEVRITWPYLINLQKSFGRASSVSNIYMSFLSKKGIRKRKYQSAVLSLLNSCYNLIGILPLYAKSGFSRKEGNRAYVYFINYKYILKENIRLLFKYRTIVRSIKEASWRTNLPDYV